MVFLKYGFDLDEKVLRTNFVCRNFQVGDKVNTHFKGKFYEGEIVQKETYPGMPWKNPHITIKTKERVDREKGALLEGYGLRGPIYGRDHTFFKDELLPEGDEIYKRMFERPMTKKEIEESKKSFEIPQMTQEDFDKEAEQIGKEIKQMGLDLPKFKK